MAEEIGFENGRNSNFQGLVALTLTLDPAIRHTVVHHSLTSTDMPNYIEIEESFCGRTDGRTDYGRTFSPSNIIRSTFGSRPKNVQNCSPYTLTMTYYTSKTAEIMNGDIILFRSLLMFHINARARTHARTRARARTYTPYYIKFISPQVVDNKQYEKKYYATKPYRRATLATLQLLTLTSSPKF